MNHLFVSTVLREFARRPQHPSALSDEEVAAIIFATIPACACGGDVQRRRRGVWCAACGKRSSLRAQTVLRGQKLSFRTVLLAIWHVRVEWRSISAHAFARRYRLRIATAWRLLHRVRATIPRYTMRARASRSQVLGRQSANNFAEAFAADTDEGARLDDCDTAPPAGKPQRQAVLAFGHVRAWLVHTYCGVTARWLDNYLAEWSARRTAGPQQCAP